MSAKRLYVIGGSNGAGKTTFATTFLPRYVKKPRFINPDLIAAGLSPFDPSAAIVAAGRMVLQEIDHAIRRGDTFAFESTLSGRTHVRLLQAARKAGYRIDLFYLWIPNPELALARIKDRTEVGGHDVPEADVMRRYPRTLQNLFHLYRPLVDALYCYDNSSHEPRLIFKDEDGATNVVNDALYASLMQKVQR
jgi:predicted ABC-type ATPase